MLRHPLAEIRTYKWTLLKRPSVQRPLVWVLALVVVGVLWQDNRDQTDAIQRSREETIRRACEQQNDRHDKTILQLDAIIADMPSGPARQEAEQNRDGTILLLDALVPKQDCDRVVQRVQQ